jgi:hypothetical protein
MLECNRDYDMMFGAVKQSDGSYIDRAGCITWYNKHGEWHREDGPAVIYASGNIRWLLNDKVYSFAEWLIELNMPDEQKMMLRLCYA